MWEPAALEQAAQGATDVVLLASLVGDPICKKYPRLAVRTNEEAPLRMMESLDSFGVGRFIFLSTCSNYGLLPPDVLASEETELNPQSLYARTKIRVEEELLKQSGDVGYAGTILRLATAYGLAPRMRFDLTVSQFVWEIATGSGLVVYDADTWRPYCHVRDISRAVVAVLTADEPLVRNEVFNVGDTREQFTKRMIVEEVQKYVPDAKIEYRSGDTDPRNYRVSFEKIADKLQFSMRLHRCLLCTQTGGGGRQRCLSGRHRLDALRELRRRRVICPNRGGDGCRVFVGLRRSRFERGRQTPDARRQTGDGSIGRSGVDSHTPVFAHQTRVRVRD